MCRLAMQVSFRIWTEVPSNNIPEAPVSKSLSGLLLATGDDFVETCSD